jgi:hypothetical protein
MGEHDKLGLGRLERVDPKTVWKHEAHDLTPWVLENLDLLGERLGIEIQPSQREVSVGSFSLDVLGEDTSGRPVIVENQLEPTNHNHLGQLLVYASGLEAAVVVWLTPTFRDEHRRALDWLNERTDDDVNFFGVELEVVRIGDSPPAPVFRVVAQPNDWQKALKRPKGLTSLAQSRHDFFELVMDAVLAKLPTFHRPKVGYNNWVSMASGPFGSYSASFTADGRFRVETYLDLVSPPDGTKLVFDQLTETDRPSIDAAFPGEDVSWERLDGKRASRVALYRQAPDFDDETDIQGAVEWAAERLVRLMGFDERFRAVATAVKKSSGSA